MNSVGVRKQSKEENRGRGGEEGKEEKGREKRGLQGREKMDNGQQCLLQTG